MRPIAELTGQQLIWLQPSSRRRNHELRAGDDVIATLNFERGSLATGTAADGQWTFKRQGFWRPRVTARTAGADTDLVTFTPHWAGGGQLDFPDGHTIQLVSGNFWQSEWAWRQDRDQPLVRFKGRHGLIKASGAVEVAPEAATRPDLALLVLLGWYLILSYAEDETAAATVTIVTT